LDSSVMGKGAWQSVMPRWQPRKRGTVTDGWWKRHLTLGKTREWLIQWQKRSNIAQEEWRFDSAVTTVPRSASATDPAWVPTDLIP